MIKVLWHETAIRIGLKKVDFEIYLVFLDIWIPPDICSLTERTEYFYAGIFLTCKHENNENDFCIWVAAAVCARYDILIPATSLAGFIWSGGTGHELCKLRNNP